MSQNEIGVDGGYGLLEEADDRVVVRFTAGSRIPRRRCGGR
jgi:hypothetical protein